MFLNIAIFFLILDITLYLIFASWLRKVKSDEACQCANDWRSRYIYVFPLVAIIVTMMSVLVLGYFSQSGMIKSGGGRLYGLYAFIMVGLFVGWILFIVFSYQYLSKLQSNECKCATTDHSGDEVLKGYTTYKVILFALAVCGIFIQGYNLARS